MAKTCSKCGRPTSSADGVCGNRAAAKCAELAAKNGNAGDDQVLDRTDLAKTPPKVKSDAVKRFRAVAEAMGHDPDALIATYCEGWLAVVKQAVDKLEAPEGSANE